MEVGIIPIPILIRHLGLVLSTTEVETAAETTAAAVATGFPVHCTKQSSLKLTHPCQATSLDYQATYQSILNEVKFNYTEFVKGKPAYFKRFLNQGVTRPCRNIGIEMTTSFQKKARGKVLQIPGAKPSLYNNQLLVSTGIPSLDQLLGGGLAVGTVMLVEEDTFGSYARLLLKYFCAESVMTGHSLMVSSADNDPDQLLKELPRPILDDPGVKDEANITVGEDDSMKIAWRYRHLPKFQSSSTAVKFGHYYDLSKTMEDDLVSTINVKMIGSEDIIQSPACNNHNPKYLHLLKSIQECIEVGGFGTSATPEKRNILRIAMHSLGSPLWGENGGLQPDDHYDPSLIKFLLGLRAILRSSFGVCVVTIPTHLFCDKAFINRVERMCDTVVHLDSFVGSEREKNPAYKEYHGLFNIKKLPSLNTLVCHMPESLDLAFKLRRKKFVIEKLHLPPDLSETASRSQEDPVPKLAAGSSCGTGGSGKSKLDF
ncbi:ELP4-like protein [Mya arenaria]|uniref:Elongator complex protein 4 n=2 Tax=Mya arenaria TaxID=6604 RepID=A0ABY7DXB5_MYAAR|nr:ELP4-like protein [Mya arenaria]